MSMVEQFVKGVNEQLGIGNKSVVHSFGNETGVKTGLKKLNPTGINQYTREGVRLSESAKTPDEHSKAAAYHSAMAQGLKEKADSYTQGDPYGREIRRIADKHQTAAEAHTDAATNPSEEHTTVAQHFSTRANEGYHSRDMHNRLNAETANDQDSHDAAAAYHENRAAESENGSIQQQMHDAAADAHNAASRAYARGYPNAGSLSEKAQQYSRETNSL